MPIKARTTSDLLELDFRWRKKLVCFDENPSNIINNYLFEVLQIAASAYKYLKQNITPFDFLK